MSRYKAWIDFKRGYMLFQCVKNQRCYDLGVERLSMFLAFLLQPLLIYDPVESFQCTKTFNRITEYPLPPQRTKDWHSMFLQPRYCKMYNFRRM